MKCTKREKLFAYALRQLDGRDEKEIREHVAQCGRCRETVEQYWKVNTVLDEWQPLEAAPWFDARVRQKIEATGAKEPSRMWPWLGGGVAWSPVRVGGVVVLLLMAMLAVLNNRRPSGVPEDGSSEAAYSPAHQNPAGAAKMRSEDELKLYENLPVLEDYDLLSDFDLLSEFKKGGKKVED